MSNLKLRYCKIVEADHKGSKRQYMHVGHHPDTICIAKSVWGLPPSHFTGLLAHEIGHLLAIAHWNDHREFMADRAAQIFLGVDIKYASTDYGENLQYLSGGDIDRFWKVSKEYF
jgi:hypothetical protein